MDGLVLLIIQSRIRTFFKKRIFNYVAVVIILLVVRRTQIDANEWDQASGRYKHFCEWELPPSSQNK